MCSLHDPGEQFILIYYVISAFEDFYDNISMKAFRGIGFSNGITDKYAHLAD
jgi:hypothetical protein